MAYVEVPHGPVPTPEVTTYPTPGIYTIPEKTITLTNTEYLCQPKVTPLPPGTHTLGGVTTIVKHQTTVTCPVAVTETVDDIVTSKVVMTTYICPTPGTYTIGPITTTITQTKVVDCEYPVVTSYEPGTYTRPETTITITKTNEVYICPTYEEVTITQTLVPVPEETSVVPTYPSMTPKEVTYPSETPKPPVETPKPPVKTSKAPVETPKAPVETPKALVEEPDLPKDSNGPALAITYSPYNDDTSCKSAEQVNADIKDIASKGFSSIRLYSSDCNGLETVGKACETYKLKIILGIFIRDTSCNADKDLENIIAWGKWELITIFVVGNEALFQGFCQPEQFAGYISQVHQKIKGAGFNGPITTTEPLSILEKHYKVLCPVMSVVSINVHPYFNPDVEASQAGPFLNSQLKKAEGQSFPTLA